MALGTRIGQKHPNLAIFNATGCPAILACYPRRMLALFEKSCLIDDQHGLRGPQMLDHIGPQIVTERIGVPLRSSQQMLDPIRGGLAVDFSDLPAVFALYRAEEARRYAPPCHRASRRANCAPIRRSTSVSHSVHSRTVSRAPSPGNMPCS